MAMDSSKLMKRVGYVVFGTYAFFNVVTLFFLTGKASFGPEISGPYGIFSSQNFFIAYHVWGIVIAILCIYAMAKEIRMLFMIGLLLMTIIMFYPYFTSSPIEKKKGQEMRDQEIQSLEIPDSLKQIDSVKMTIPAIR